MRGIDTALEAPAAEAPAASPARELNNTDGGAMRRTLTVSVITILCFSGFAFAARSEENPENFMQMHMIESTWHQAATTKNVDLMMSLFADDAAVTSGGKTYTGKDQIRRFWQAGKAFQPQSQLIGYTPPYRLKYDLEGNSGHLYFECLYVDNATKKIVTHVGVQADLIRANGRWLIKGAKSTPLPQL
ncbi:MAG: nuclear transport factor 2 family protein [Stellaceae bacterium]|jgi:hypothetical protein